MTSRETPILHAVRATLAGECMCHRNNTGVDTTRGVRYGLGVGGADLIACVPMHVIVVPDGTPGAVRIGRYAGFETKAPKRGPSPEQRQWALACRQAGGFYAIVRSPEAALEALDRAAAGALE